MKHYIILLFSVIIFGSCQKQLELNPQDKLSPDQAFSTESNLKLYVNSFYENGLPGANALFTRDAMSDITAQTVVNTYITGTGFTSQSAGVGPVASIWSWSELRNINYFLQHYHEADAPQARKDHYAGIARYFRALFYFEMVKMYGDVPWYNKPLAPGDETELYKPRDSRTLVMDSVLADINFATQKIDDTKDNSSSTVTRAVAFAMKSRICLFEGTFRKYHTQLGLGGTANTWLQEAANAAEAVMNGGRYTLNTNYRALFTSENPVSAEVMLANVFNNNLRRWHDANWTFTGASYGGNISFVKRFINTFLKIEGSRFTDQSDYNDIEFQQEVKGRDQRLGHSIRIAPYTRSDGSAAPPDFGQTFTGYQIKKYTMDDKVLDPKAENYNSIPLIRYAEVLLNYAEAKAEMGILTTADWNKSIGLLRARAGISNTSMPSTLDPYMKANFFTNIDAIDIMEIRRERGIELAMEGFRFDDLKRWREAKLLEKVFDGMYVPAMNQALDLNEDGKQDVIFVTTIPTVKLPGVVYYRIDNTTTRLSQGTKGNILWRANVTKTFPDHKYFAPIPYTQTILNPNLAQNPGWQ